MGRCRYQALRGARGRPPLSPPLAAGNLAKGAVAKVEITLNALKKKGVLLSTGARNVIVLTPARLHVLDLEDAHFNFDRSIVLPDLARVDGSPPVLDERRVTGLGVILAALVHVQRNPAQRIARGLFDIFAYAVGADGFNAGDALHGATLAAPFDLIIVVRVKMAWSLMEEDHADYEEGRKLLARARNTLHVAFNQDRRVLAHGTFEGRSVRARVLFSPRFISRKFPSGSSSERTKYLKALKFDPKQEADYTVFVNDLVSTHGVHCEVEAIEDPDPRGFTVSSGPKREARVDVDDLDDEIIDVFGQLVGLAKPTTKKPGDFAPLVDLVSGFARRASDSMEFVE